MLTDLDYELLSNYLDDALDNVQRAALETRLNGETELRHELEALRSTVALISALPPRKAPRNFTLDASMARRPAPPRRMFFSPVLASALSAAAAVLLIGFGLLSLTSNQSAAPQAFSSGAQQQQGVAQIPTASPLLKTDDGTIALNTTEEPQQPAGDALLSDTETPTIDPLDQASGSGGEATFSRDQQDAQSPPSALPSDSSANTATLPDDTVDAPFFAPSVPVGTIEGYTTGFPGAESNLVQGSNAQTGAADTAAQSNPIAAAPTFIPPTQSTLGIVVEEVALTQTLTTTPSPSITPTETPTPSETPTDTPVPPTLPPEPTLVPVTTTASTVELLPLASLMAGVILLLVALVFYLRSRRNA